MLSKRTDVLKSMSLDILGPLGYNVDKGTWLHSVIAMHGLPSPGKMEPQWYMMCAIRKGVEGVTCCLQGYNKISSRSRGNVSYLLFYFITEYKLHNLLKLLSLLA